MTYSSIVADNRRYDFPRPGEVLTLEINNERFGKLRFSVRWSTKTPSPNITFNLARVSGGDLCRLETGGYHKNPTKEAPDELLEKFRGYSFEDEPHLHLFYPGRKFEWAVPLSITDFFLSDPIGVMLRAVEQYCGIADPLPIDIGLFEDVEFNFHSRPHFPKTESRI